MVNKGKYRKIKFKNIGRISMTTIIETLKKHKNKGSILELVTKDVLADYGFQNIRKQNSGSQYGFDLVANTKSKFDDRQEIWKFECKNLSTPINIDDIAPKLIWYLGSNTIDHFVIVSTSDISNDLDHLLSEHQFPMPIHVWSGSTLEKIIFESPLAMKRLGLESQINTDKKNDVIYIERLDKVYLPKEPVSLDVFHELDPPHAIDYLLINNNQLVKAYTEKEFRLFTCVTNWGRFPFDIYSLSVVTSNYINTTNQRILREIKPKGIYEPVKLIFNPTTTIGSEKNILQGKVFQVDAGKSEMISICLADSALPGFYEIYFKVRGKLSNKTITLFSPKFLLNIIDRNTNLLLLNVSGFHYDSPTQQILNYDDSTWENLKQLTTINNKTIYLGPSPYEIQNRIVDQKWYIRSVETLKTPIEDGYITIINPQKPSKIELDLNLPIDEELFSIDTVFKRITGQNGWQDLLPLQLERRMKIQK